MKKTLLKQAAELSKTDPSRAYDLVERVTRTAGSEHYLPLFSELVDAVDEVDEARKALRKAVSSLDKLEALAKKDEDFNSSDPKGDKAYGLKQQIGEMRKSITKFEASALDLDETYDEMNRWFLRQGLK